MKMNSKNEKTCASDRSFSHIILDESILQFLPKRVPDSNKGTYGKVLCIAGTKNMAGAAYLSAYAAYRTGAGLVRIFTPEENRIILQELLPEAILTTFDRSAFDEHILLEALAWADVAVIGPGMGKEIWVDKILQIVFSQFQKSLIVDADALNHLSKQMELLKKCQAEMIVTPHIGEFSRLTGLSVQEIKKDVPRQAANFAETYACICVLKDAKTAIGSKSGECWVNTTGNHGMSTGGSGDVLTGILAGLLAQGLTPLSSALLGVWLHGRSGDVAARKEGYYGLMARHLIEYLPKAMNNKESEKE